MLGDPSFTEMFFQNFADHTALGTFTAEASLLAGTNRQAVIPRGFFSKQGKALRITAAGVLSSTGTPTYLFTNRLGATQGASDLTGTAVGVSAAITTGSGVSNQGWSLILDIVCRTPGQGANNTTLSCFGWVKSGGGLASPFEYMLTPGGGASATWTATVNNAVDLYPNLSVTCSASSASNTITCKEYKVEALN
jgi:hypothetical protein